MKGASADPASGRRAELSNARVTSRPIKRSTHPPGITASRSNRPGRPESRTVGAAYSTVTELFPTGVNRFPGGPRIGSATSLLADPFFNL